MTKLISILKIIFQMMFIVCVIMFVTFYIVEKMDTDTTIPIIRTASDELVVSVNATERDLLANVTARDEKDGNLSPKVIVESISGFVEPDVCRITYAVCDSDNHVTTKTIRLRYDDYRSPRFSLDRSLCYSLLERVNIASVVHVDDVFDGDLQKELSITSEDYQAGTIGMSYVTLEAANSKGDRVTLKLPVYIDDIEQNAPTITLKQYLYYAATTETVDPMEFLQSATDAYREDLSAFVTTEVKYDCLSENVYSIHYYVEDRLNRRAHTSLIVVVGG